MPTSKTSLNQFKTALLKISLVLGALSILLLYLNSPTGNKIIQEIHISQGMNARQIGQLLQEKALIRQAIIFEWTARFQRVSHHLKAGVYHLDGSETTTTLLRRLLDSPLVQQQRITIPEGLTRHQIASLFQHHSGRLYPERRWNRNEPFLHCGRRNPP